MAPLIAVCGCKGRLFFRHWQIFTRKIARVSKKCSTFALAFKASGCSAVGSALRSGRRGRAFESPHPDKKARNGAIRFSPFYLFCPLRISKVKGQSENGSVRKPGCIHNSYRVSGFSGWRDCKLFRCSSFFHAFLAVILFQRDESCFSIECDESFRRYNSFRHDMKAE